MAFNWTCPHCDRAQTITQNRYSKVTTSAGVSDVAEGSLAFERISIGCSNPECLKLTITVQIGTDIGPSQVWRVDPTRVLFSERLLPRGAAKPQPDYIPAPLREDYLEACLIRELSPKASATLARRCLQGMIRDFTGITKSRLIDEVRALARSVEDGTADRSITTESVAAIDHVRSLGNIGAHFESDINVIVPVDAGEAQTMIELIEMLFDDWYGERFRRIERLEKIAAIRAEKDGIKIAAKALQAPPEKSAAANQ